MPIYEYECKKCGYRFEQLQKVTEKALHTCPQCKKSGLVKLISNTSFQLKGTGWYVTDFKNKTENSPSVKKASSKSEEVKKPEPVVAKKPKTTEKK